MQFADSVAVVTGAAAGLGRAVAHRLAAEGATVVVADVDAAGAATVAAEVGGRGVAADLGTPEGVRAVCDLARAELGGIDLWCSNAALSGAADLLDYDLERWQATWQLNVMSHVWAARELLPGWLDRGRGHLCQTVSAVALTLNHYDPAYAVTKRAALALNEYLAVRYGDRGIGVTAFCPRGMLTERLVASETPTAAGRNAMATAVTPERAAQLVVDGVRTGAFLVLTELDEIESHRRKAADTDGWIAERRRQLAAELVER